MWWEKVTAICAAVTLVVLLFGIVHLSGRFREKVEGHDKRIEGLEDDSRKQGERIGRLEGLVEAVR